MSSTTQCGSSGAEHTDQAWVAACGLVEPWGQTEGCEQMWVTEAHPLARCCFSGNTNAHVVPVTVSLNGPGPLMGKASILIHSPPK